MADKRWWTGHKLVNGVFKGGGAKGVVYAGALEALHEQKLWFGAVAGTSAGAITASLIAAGECPAGLRTAVPQMLAAVKRSIWRTALGLSDAFYDNRALSVLLEARYRQAIAAPEDRSEPVSFAELEDHTGLALYVVALDLALQRPVVFNPYSTPGVSVSAAVLASTAIPGAFPSGRAVWASDMAPVVHRLVDGGAWANYPRFVFEDDSFVGWLENGTGVSLASQRSRPTIGFALGDELSPAPPSPAGVLRYDTGMRDFDEGTALTARNPAVWALGLGLSGRTARLFLAVSATLAAFAMWFLGIPETLRDLWGWVDGDQTGVLPLLLFIVSTLVVVAAVATTAGAALLVLLGKPLGDVLLPSARAALAVGTQLPPWLGHAENDHVVLLPVGGLTTTGFQPNQTEVDNRIADAKRATLDYLAGQPSISEQAQVEKRSAHVQRSAIEESPTPSLEHEGLEDPQAYFWVILGLVGTSGMVTFSLMTGHPGLVVFGAVAVLFLAWLLAGTSSSYQASLASGARSGLTKGTPGLVVAIAALVLGLGAAAVGVVEAADREAGYRDERARVRILSARWLPERERRDETGYRYQYEYAFTNLDSGRRVKVAKKGTFRLDRRLQPQDVVLVQPNEYAKGRLDLVNPTPDRFFRPVIISCLGLGAVLWAVRLLRIRRRDRSLERRLPAGATPGAAL